MLIDGCAPPCPLHITRNLQVCRNVREAGFESEKALKRWPWPQNPWSEGSKPPPPKNEKRTVATLRHVMAALAKNLPISIWKLTTKCKISVNSMKRFACGWKGLHSRIVCKKLLLNVDVCKTISNIVRKLPLQWRKEAPNKIHIFGAKTSSPLTLKRTSSTAGTHTDCQILTKMWKRC